MPGKILVADDEAGIVSLLREDLEGRGYLVYTCLLYTSPCGCSFLSSSPCRSRW